MPTEAQITANRQNAQKSTGPQTPEGKAAVSRNALRHATLARHILVSSPDSGESAAEFKALCEEYYNAYAPLGPAEELLVDQIVAGTWRVQRARLAESAEIALSLKAAETARTQRRTANLGFLVELAAANPGGDILDQAVRTPEGCDYLIHEIAMVRAAVVDEKSLTAEAMDELEGAFGGAAKSLTAPLFALQDEFKANPGRLKPNELSEKHQRDVIAFLDSKLEYYIDVRFARHGSKEEENRRLRNAAMLPSAQTLAKIQRYEAAAERQIYRAMNQLQKLQSRRTAEASFATANPPRPHAHPHPRMMGSSPGDAAPNDEKRKTNPIPSPSASATPTPHSASENLLQPSAISLQPSLQASQSEKRKSNPIPPQPASPTPANGSTSVSLTAGAASHLCGQPSPEKCKTKPISALVPPATAPGLKFDPKRGIMV